MCRTALCSAITLPHPARWRGAVHALAAMLALAMLSACGPRYEAPLSVGTNTWAGYAPLYLARELGLNEGLNVRLVELGSSTQSMDALRTGRLDLAGLTLDETLTLAQEGVPLAVVWVLDISRGADALVARASIPNLHSLQGHRVGVEQTAVGAYLLHAALAKAKLQASDITVVPLPLDEQIPAWREGHVDALVTFDPVLQTALNAGAQVLFDSSEIPGQIVDVLVARKEALACCAARIARLIHSQQRALEYMASARSDALQRMAPRLGISSAELDAAFGGMDLPDAQANRALLAGPAAPLTATAQRMGHTMLGLGLLPHPIGAETLIDPRFARGGTH